MSVKLGRYIFRKIGGRIVPIRAGAKATDSSSGVSKGALRKLKLLLKSSEVKLTKAGNLRKFSDHDGYTDYMIDFMKKTGSARVSKSGSTMVSISSERALTSAQKRTFMDMGKDVESVYTENEEVFRLADAFRISQGKKPAPKTKTARKLIEKAKAKFGITDNPNTAGYITPDGDMLDFSGGGGFERYEDHRGIAAIMPSPALKKLKDKDFSRILMKEQSKRKYLSGKPHAHWKYLDSIKKLQKVDFITGKDRGELIKDNIRYIPNHKMHLLKKLKKSRKK
jgi:hypothetical protein